MSDLIDREALLRQIDIDSEGEPGYYGDTWKFIDTIKRMPSALGTNLAEVGTGCSEFPNNSDAISRQAAIDALAAMPCKTDEDGYVWIVRFDAWTRIDTLPSAEPIRGKWIKDGHHIRCDQCGMYMCDTDREGDRIPTEFCPHCGADMRQKGENSESN